jgi:glucose/arabinose dehydrogenase
MRRLLTVLLGLVLLETCFAGPGQAAPAKPRPQRPAAALAPVLQVRAIARGLHVSWDVKPVSGGRLLITERSSKRLLTLRKAKLRRVAYAASTV